MDTRWVHRHRPTPRRRSNIKCGASDFWLNTMMCDEDEGDNQTACSGIVYRLILFFVGFNCNGELHKPYSTTMSICLLPIETLYWWRDAPESRLQPIHHVKLNNYGFRLRCRRQWIFLHIFFTFDFRTLSLSTDFFAHRRQSHAFSAWVRNETCCARRPPHTLSVFGILLPLALHRSQSANNITMNEWLKTNDETIDSRSYYRLHDIPLDRRERDFAIFFIFGAK